MVQGWNDGSEDYNIIYRQKKDIAELKEVLAGLLADIQEYQRINNLGGEDNHWQVRAKQVLDNK